ncbi:MAG: DNA topoisomerase IB [Acidimicrobiales bacterium]|nr:DNA topoisomerase IB [Acidimicrobiales bacterium]
MTPVPHAPERHRDGPVASGLVHSCDAEPGIVRRGTRRFRYETPDGRPVRDPDVLARIASLAIPPAWTDVWICIDPCGHLQATGRDAKGRKQSRYHPDFRAERERTKFDQLVVFGAALGSLRTTVAHDLAERRPTLRRQTALVVHLLDRTGIRVGNEAYVRANGSYGLSTLRTRQARVHGAAVTFRFVGKSGRRHTVAIEDRRLARLVAQCQDLPGQHLFTYLDESDGATPIVRVVDSTSVNDYLRDATGQDVTAKTFRTWLATTTVGHRLATEAMRDPERVDPRVVSAAVDEAAVLLGNTRTVCRASYVHPAVPAAYHERTLASSWRAGPARPTAGMSTVERRTLHLLRETSMRRDTAGAPHAPSRAGLGPRVGDAA